MWETVAGDYKSFYDLDTLAPLGVGVSIAAYMANSSIDEDLQAEYIDDTSRRRRHNFSRSIGRPGHILISLAILSSTWGVARMLGDDGNSASSMWAKRSLRSVLVGAPVMLPLQNVTGASRPYEDNGSDWRLLEDSNTTSGHAFVGSIPFLVAGRMNENPWIRYPIYALSALPAWSRVKRNRHYPSQALLGWWVGWLSVESVFDAEQSETVKIMPWADVDAFGLRLDWSF